LRRDVPLDAPATAFFAKNFSRGELCFVRIFARAQACTKNAICSAGMARCCVIERCRNQLSIGISTRAEFFFSKSRGRKYFCIGVRAESAADAQRCAAKRRLYTKLSGNTVIFFPLV